MNVVVISQTGLPAHLNGHYRGIDIRPVQDGERIGLEYWFDKNRSPIVVSTSATVVSIPVQSARISELNDLVLLIECAFGMVSTSGYQSCEIVAKLSGQKILLGEISPAGARIRPPAYVEGLSGLTLAALFHRVWSAYVRAGGKIHVTTDRFVRFLRNDTSPDALVDLCISLESLLDAKTEISFRFSTLLAKQCGTNNAKHASDTLGRLYDFRSKVVHGADPRKEYSKLEPMLPALRQYARQILGNYFLFLSEGTKEAWRVALKDKLLE